MSKILLSINDDSLNMFNLTDKEKEVIAIINSRVKSIGMSSSKIVGQDDLDFEQYKDSSVLSSVEMEGSAILNMEYPYNDIILNKNINMWRLLCAQIYFRIYYNIIPNEFYTKTTFPKIVIIKRSDGKLQRARIKQKGGFRISKTSFDDEGNVIPKLYVRVEFNNSDVDLEDYFMPKECYKDVSIENISKLNPYIKDFDVTFSLPNFLCHKYDDFKYNVIKYYHDLHNEWCEDVLHPLIKYIKKKYDINIKINTNII